MIIVMIKPIQPSPCSRNFATGRNNREIPKYTRKSIPKVLKNLVWDTNIGEECGNGECYCCAKKINSKHFETGHIIAVNKGGTNTLDNLKPICSCCNKSMGTMNMDIFKHTYMTHIVTKERRVVYPPNQEIIPTVISKKTISYSKPYKPMDLLHQYPRRVYIKRKVVPPPRNFRTNGMRKVLNQRLNTPLFSTSNAVF